jgi:hypothetical protein
MITEQKFDTAYCDVTDQIELVRFLGDTGYCNACGSTEHEGGN